MPFFTETIDTQPKRKTLQSVLAAVSNALSRIVAAQNRSVDVQRMQNLTDRELAKMGLHRDVIVRHVYRDIYYV